MPGLTGSTSTDVAAGFENKVKEGTPFDESGSDPAAR
jgi:hypothetical protein